MATMRGNLILTFVVLVVFTFLHLCVGCSFDAIYQFGDSTSDTGNMILENAGFASRFAKSPYGQNYPNKVSTGRCSNGLLMIDYFASAFSLPSPKPYLGKDKDFKSGVNFAVAGATAIPTDVLEKFNVPQVYTLSTLDVQVNWFETHLKSICSNKAASKLNFHHGDIGSNDYIYARLRRSYHIDVNALTPLAIKAIGDGIQRLIDLGASRIIVPGNFPSGCLPSNLEFYKANDTKAYDELGCLQSFNSFTTNHNTMLKAALDALKSKNPEVTLLYGDLYESLRTVVRDAAKIGLDAKNILNTCCGAHWKPYNYDQIFFCGAVKASVCSNPESQLHWDGLYLTQAGYKAVADLILGDVTPKLKSSSFSLPSPKPYLGTDKDFKTGVNFAVAWATALATPVLAKFNIPHWYTDSSLLVQISWFETYVASICSNKTDCKKKLENSIFIVGDVGSTDYMTAKLRHLNHLRIGAGLTPLIAKTIAEGVQRLIDHGASRIIVPGSLPAGCLTSNLDYSRSNYSRAYDEFGCLKSLNAFAANHNTLLIKALEGVRAKNPEVTLLYGDAFRSYQKILRNAERYGLTKNNTLNACCGAPWKEYNYDQFSLCGIVNTTVCSEPEKYLNWDGTSLTQSGYKRVVNWILHHLTPLLKCNSGPKLPTN
ncbi:hypothetical protein Sjap_016616 [Stephania japonica]|uniref:Uncharacterized protein n=1 Tax=Stephania japonica TaxID=461633 RepID=A0AAP0NTL7_9MAGN